MPAASDIHYHRLEDEDSENFEKPPGHRNASSLRGWLQWKNMLIVAQFFVIVILGSNILWRTPAPSSSAAFPQALYSPAEAVALNFQARVFNMSLRSPSIYTRPPSDEVDKAWTDLYEGPLISQIPKSQARLLPNKTQAIPGDEDNYVVGIAVFHQLHCLDMVRKGLTPEHYTNHTAGTTAGIAISEWPGHLSHCLDAVRQALVCSADVSSIVWQWSELTRRTGINMDVAHSCRNYDMIYDWGMKHRLKSEMNLKINVEDDIVIPPF